MAELLPQGTLRIGEYSLPIESGGAKECPAKGRVLVIADEYYSTDRTLCYITGNTIVPLSNITPSYLKFNATEQGFLCVSFSNDKLYFTNNTSSVVVVRARII